MGVVTHTKYRNPSQIHYKLLIVQLEYFATVVNYILSNIRTTMYYVVVVVYSPSSTVSKRKWNQETCKCSGRLNWGTFTSAKQSFFVSPLLVILNFHWFGFPYFSSLNWTVNRAERPLCIGNICIETLGTKLLQYPVIHSTVVKHWVKLLSGT